MNIIFDISGGLGKNILSTAVLKAIKTQHPKAKVIVLTSYPDVFIGNPNVNKVIVHNTTASIYKDYIENKEAKVFITDPYTTSDYLTESKHLIEIWCNLFGIKYNGELPELFISKSEVEYFAPFYQLDKPIMAIQPNGGPVDQALKYSWTRDIPTPVMIDVIDHYKKDYAIVHIKREDQIAYADTMAALDSFRSIAVLLSLSSRRLLIDSSAMHIATALNLPSIVCWIGTSSKVFGYDMHGNIEANAPDKELNLDHPYLQRLPLFEDISRCPYTELSNIFNSEDIIKALK
jgi:ADP-heptose:LPS heptosyltransferase